MKSDEFPLVTIGVPTFNRAEGLRRTLDHITKQTYTNLEIIVSDNCSPDGRVEDTVQEFLATDRRIQYFRQSQNRGPSFNFNFVLSQASGRYFMWAADDDYFESSNLVEELLKADRGNVLAFPDFNLSGEPDNSAYSIYQSIYGSCQSNDDYLLAWCRNGLGYPFYGLYNLEQFEKRGLEFKFDEDLSYNSEGTFLHKLFLVGDVKFVPGIYINASTLSQKPDALTQLKSFTSYTQRTLLIYLKCKMELKKKVAALRSIFNLHCEHEAALFASAWKETSRRDLILYSITNPIAMILVSAHIPRYVILRLSPTSR